MRIGLHALGIGSGADPEVILAVARAADEVGFSTLWAGEHVVLVDRPDSPYPYADDGRIAVPSDADWLDPMTALPFAAAVTSRIRLATGILLLPEHHPVLVAKQAASIDVLSSGRFVLGVGIGWSSEEFGALGIPYAGRAARTAEYVDVLRTLWSDDPASFDGEHVSFRDVRCFPKPVRDRIPVVLGGNSDAALDRVATYGDGWYGFAVARDELAGRIGYLRLRCARAGRDPGSIWTAVAVLEGTPGDIDAAAGLGIDELVVVEAPPPLAVDADRWVRRLADRWGVAPA
jgi:probable F420-dependent oxidoreductase